ncbi:uncharacterized protein LOC124879587 isoform X2 [Girardinichthys multiradiatus]|uniref:uncharacterized protein LOC124879587 isoform X2 n=1 Tax=Girardinichthys multiradiatus TaxID=208333 RepID=UPI001FADC55A|nr:uncharacterized protein LOC124879587 isoform X2 [Girardinichthys multiradiatus]
MGQLSLSYVSSEAPDAGPEFLPLAGDLLPMTHTLNHRSRVKVNIAHADLLLLVGVTAGAAAQLLLISEQSTSSRRRRQLFVLQSVVNSSTSAADIGREMFLLELLWA